jgi:hypothetical protein
MGLEKEIEFDADGRTYRVVTRLGNTYDIHGFNSLHGQVSIHTDLNTGDKIFVAWSGIPVLRFKDAGDDAQE